MNPTNSPKGDGMDARNRTLLFVVSVMIVLSGCAHVISGDLQAKIDPSLTFTQVLQTPDIYKGKMVLWGGEIIQMIPQKDGSVLMEVLQRPFGLAEKPETTFASEGTFLALINAYSEGLSSLRKGGLITVAGEIQGAVEGEKMTSLSDIGYRYPLILSRQIYNWSDYDNPYPRYRYGPWWYDPLDRRFDY